MSNGIVNIHGKEYQTVALRVQMFREKFPDYGLRTRILDSADSHVVMVAEIWRDDFLIATGHAEEKRGSTQINKTSALENCETSAIGRALSALGLGGTEFASANEVQNAIHQQGKKPEAAPQKQITEEHAAHLVELAQEAPGGMDRFSTWLKASYHVDSTFDLTENHYEIIKNTLEGAIKKAS